MARPDHSADGQEDRLEDLPQVPSGVPGRGHRHPVPGRGRRPGRRLLGPAGREHTTPRTVVRQPGQAGDLSSQIPGQRSLHLQGKEPRARIWGKINCHRESLQRILLQVLAQRLSSKSNESMSFVINQLYKMFQSKRVSELRTIKRFQSVPECHELQYPKPA